MRKLALSLLFSSFLILGTGAKLTVLAACNPPQDYSSCEESLFGSHLAGNLLDQNNQAIKAEQNFAELRSQAEAANPDNQYKQIQSTVMVSPDLIRDTSAMNGVLAAAQEYGIHLTVIVEVTQDEAKEVGGLLQNELSGANMVNSVNVEVNQEANIHNISGSEYGSILSQFVSGCDSCRIFLPALGGPPLPETDVNKNQFVQDFVSNYPDLFQKVYGIAFNSYAADPQGAITDWLTSYGFWQQAATGVGQTIEGKTIFLTEVGPPNGDANWANLDSFLVSLAQDFEKLKATDPRFANVEGLTFFLWLDNDGNKMVITYVDGKTLVTLVKKRLVNQGRNLQKYIPKRGNGVKPLQNFPDEQEIACDNNVYGVPNGEGANLYRKSDGQVQSEMRTDANINYSGLVQGTHCGQVKSQPIVLEEVAPFGPDEGPLCKTAWWIGEVRFGNPETNFRIPFAEQIADHWAGTLDAEHMKESDIDKLYSDAYPNPNLLQTALQTLPLVGNALSGLPSAQQQLAAVDQIASREGVLKRLESKDQQDQLKCSFINYVRSKGNVSLYKDFTIEGTKLTDIPCPPTVTNPNASMTAYTNWQSTWGSKWAKMALIPNEKTIANLRFMVCGDRQYLQGYSAPEVFRLGLSANELFKVYTAKDNQTKYYYDNNDNQNLKLPLDKNSALALDQTGTGFVASAEVQDDKVASIQEPFQRESLITKLKDILSEALSKGQKALSSLNIKDILAQGCDPLEAGIEVTPGTTLNYSVYIRKTACGQQQYPGTIGDIQIYILGGTPHTENLYKGNNELRWDTTNPETVSFLPRVSSIDDLNKLVLMFRADRIGLAPREIRYLGATTGGLPGQPSPGPSCNQTPTCTASCKLCSRSQLGPSDTTMLTPSNDPNITTNHVMFGVDWTGFLNGTMTEAGPNPVKLVWWIPGWDGRFSNLPAGCKVLPPCSPSDLACLATPAYRDPDTGQVARINCAKVHERVVDIYNDTPFLASVWNQAAASSVSQVAGFLNVFKPKCDPTDPNSICSHPATPSNNFTDCSTNESYVFDSAGNFSTNPAATYLTYGFTPYFTSHYINQFTNGVTVSQISPKPGEKAKVLFYRLGGLCNADTWVGSKALFPQVASAYAIATGGMVTPTGGPCAGKTISLTEYYGKDTCQPARAEPACCSKMGSGKYALECTWEDRYWCRPSSCALIPQGQSRERCGAGIDVFYKTGAELIQ